MDVHLSERSPCDTGAQNTLREALKPCIDWVSVTFKELETYQVIKDVLLMNPDDFVDIEYGHFGYRRSKKLGGITIFFDGREGMGVHLQMTGQGCRLFEQMSPLTWKAFFEVCLSYDGQFTRIDLALDDFKGYFSVKTLIRKIKRKECISKFKKGKREEDLDLGEGSTEGETLYIGRQTSRVRIRFYNKKQEVLSEQEISPENLPDVWIRTEIQLRQERAQTVAHLLTETEIGLIQMGILKYYIRFLKKGKDKNKARWKTAPFWEKFLKGIEPVKLAEKKKEVFSSVSRRMSWLRKQVAPSLALILEAEDGDMKQIYSLIREGNKRLKAKDLAMIQEHKKEKASIQRVAEEAIS